MPQRLVKMAVALAFFLLFFISIPVFLANPSHAESLGSWTSTTTYPLNVADQYCVVSSGYIYCVGGYNGNALTSAVNYAPVSSTGMGLWIQTTSYPIKIGFMSCVTSSGYIYCVGGDSDSGYTNAVYYAPVSSSGVGAWTSTTSYPTNAYLPSCVTSSGYIYCVGGYDGSDFLNSVDYAPISSSGVGAWASTTSYPTIISVASCAITSSYIYCVGGIPGGSDYVNSVYYAPVSPSGVGAWTSTTSYPTIIGTPRGCTFSGGYMYCVGGIVGNSTAGVATNAVYFAPAYSSGMGSWASTTSYPTDIRRESCTAYSGYIYCVAGYNGNSFTGATYYSIVNPVTTMVTTTVTKTATSTVTITPLPSTTTVNKILPGPTTTVAGPTSTVTTTSEVTMTNSVVPSWAYGAMVALPIVGLAIGLIVSLAMGKVFRRPPSHPP